MKTLYAVRHRVAGIVSTHLYAKPPTDAQLMERKAEADEIWGCPGVTGEKLAEQRAAKFPKNWVKVEEVKLVEGDELDPYVPPRNPVGETKGRIDAPKIQMTGHVGPEVPSNVATNPEVPSKKR